MFSSLKDVRLDGGFQIQERKSSLYDSGGSPAEGDGTTTVFYTKYRPIVDDNGDDVVNTTAVSGVYDVIVYVNGTSVSITSIDAAQGKITLAAAPANGAVISISYAWSSIDDAMVTLYRRWAYAKIISTIAKVYAMPVDQTSTNPDFAGSDGEAFLHSMEVELAAGNILMITYTEQNDGLHKQGEIKVKAVTKMLDEIRSGKIQLLDSEYAEFQRLGTLSMGGYPDGSESSEQANKFSVSDRR